MSLHSFFREDVQTDELLQSSLPTPILDEGADRYPCPPRIIIDQKRKFGAFNSKRGIFLL